MKSKDEIYATVTDTIVAALEQGASAADWRAPWHSSGVNELPFNVVSKKLYRGVNTIVLWSQQMVMGYASNEWATYDQWEKLGAQVRKGEKATLVILWKPVSNKAKRDAGEERDDYLLTRSYNVFNADQVDGYETIKVERDPFAVNEAAHAFFASLGADVRHGGASAYYTPAADRIQLPLPEDFTDGVGYYATSAHEHTHWTGHETRCNRDLVNRFGSESYAAEELVAELGAAYVCGILGLSNEPRLDHAQYIASWITLLKHDSSAIVTAASKAQQAVDFMVKLAESKTEEEVSA